MPKIDPSQLLDCLDSLLGSDGGIKGETEVKRLAVLMTKFSKKLVSKCIYILILKNTEPDLLAKFMAEGGWALIFQWLDEGICNNNHALICEILELLLKCPISLDRLKENNCPKVVKGLSKDSESEDVKRLAGKLVEQWLKFIKSGQAAISDVAMAAASAAGVPKPAITVLPSNITVVSALALGTGTSGGGDIRKQSVLTRKVSKPEIHIVREVSSSDEEEVPPIGSLPLYKITVRDGKSVLAKVGSKTLSAPASNKNEEGFEPSSPVSSVMLKTDSGSKKFRYITKAVAEKEKSYASESQIDDATIRDKNNVQCVADSTSGDGSSKHKVMLLKSEKDECHSPTKDKDKLFGSKIKHFSSKSDNNKLKDGHVKLLPSKTNKNQDSNKDDTKCKDRERKSNRDSEKDKKKNQHRSHKADRERDCVRDKDVKEKSKDKDSSAREKRRDEKDFNKSKSKDKPKKEEKESKNGGKWLSAAEKAQLQADKDKDTLERLKTPAIGRLGKIPKKSPTQGSSTSNSEGENPEVKSEVTKSENKMATPAEDPAKKPISGKPSKVRPKTVKTFNSKFRSTGLEEEIKPPPPRASIKKKAEEKRPATKMEASFKESHPPEKKLKLVDISGDFKKEKIMEKPGGIKLIPPKPKPALLESDMFSDALTASTKFEPRKRKRRSNSTSKESSEAKKDVKEEAIVSVAADSNSPKDVKPSLKFYRDTLEEEDEKKKQNSEEGKSESNEEDSEKVAKGDLREGDNPAPKLYPNGVLVCKTKKGPKKSVKWKEDFELTSVRLFELDETERVNVTRTFVDMKLMERSHEREAFQLARKLATEDTMEERIPWGPLYEVDIPLDRRSTVEPGKSSLEKNVQYAREKTVLQAIYFHRSLIPDSPSEPDPEVHPTTDPKIIPLDDITGNSDSVCNFQNVPWPEPKAAVVPQSPPPPQGPQGGGQVQQHGHGHQGPHPQGFGAPGYSTVAAFPGFPQMAVPGMMPPPGQGSWRAGDGKDLGIGLGFQPNGPMCPPQMGQPPNMFNPPGPEGFPMNGPSVAGFNPGFQMACDPNMYGPPMGGMNMGGPPPGQWGRGGGGWQGGRPFLGPMNMQPKFQKGVCHHFAKFGNCARGNSCRFMHPN